MKKMILFSILCISAEAFASSTYNSCPMEIVNYALSSEIVKNDMADRQLQSISCSSETSGTSWSYKIRLKSVEDGISPRGVDTHPCFTNITVSTVGGIAGTEILEPVVETTCAVSSL